MTKKPEFKGMRKKCKQCRELWPWMDIDESNLCPECKPPSHLDTLKETHPDFPWPAKGEKGHYPEEIGATLGDKRHFGFPPKQYTLILRTSSEDSAVTRVEQYNAEGKQALITYNPIRLETYGVWIR